MTKNCKYCDSIKSIDQFYFCKANKDKLSYYCKKCMNALNRKGDNEYKEKNRKRINEQNTKNRIKYRERNIAHTLRRNFWPNLTSERALEEYNKIYNKQNGCCYICLIPNSSLNKKLCVDHCHKSGKIRGLLCGKCNTFLGLVNDSIDLLKRAKEYLTEYK